MSFDNMERRARSGGPVTVFRFRTGPETYFLLADSAHDITVGSETFKAAAISSDDIENSVILDTTSISIKLPRSEPIVAVFGNFPPSYIITCEAFIVHPEDADLEMRRVFYGRVTGCSVEGMEATLVCDPPDSNMNQIGLRRTYGYRCPHVLYGNFCRAAKVPVDVTVSFLTQVPNAFVLTPASALGGSPVEHFLAGTVEWGLPGGGRELRSIIGIEAVSDELRVTITGPVASAPPGTVVSLFKGCEHNEASCTTRFDNILNYGGQPWIPQKNPIGKASTYY